MKADVARGRMLVIVACSSAELHRRDGWRIQRHHRSRDQRQLHHAAELTHRTHRNNRFVIRRNPFDSIDPDLLSLSLR